MRQSILQLHPSGHLHLSGQLCALLELWCATLLICHPAAGYGQQGPVSTLDAWITSLSLLVGMFIWTYLTSVFITLLIHMNAASSEYTVKSAALDSFMSYRRLPKVCAVRRCQQQLLCLPLICLHNSAFQHSLLFHTSAGSSQTITESSTGQQQQQQHAVLCPLHCPR